LLMKQFRISGDGLAKAANCVDYINNV